MGEMRRGKGGEKGIIQEAREDPGKYDVLDLM